MNKKLILLFVLFYTITVSCYAVDNVRFVATGPFLVGGGDAGELGFGPLSGEHATELRLSLSRKINEKFFIGGGSSSGIILMEIESIQLLLLLMMKLTKLR